MTENLPAVKESGSMFFDVAKFEHAQRVARVFMEASMVPAHFKGNVGNCLIALNYAERLGADPFMVMQNMCIIHGKPGLEGKLIIALLNTSGRFEPVEFEETGNLNEPKNDSDGCRAYAKDIKSGKVLKGPMVDWRMVKAEGWFGKTGSKWKTMAPLMFMYRAATYFARVYAPEITFGLQTREELVDIVEMEQGDSGGFSVVEVAVDTSEFDRLAGANIDYPPDPSLDRFLAETAKANDISIDQLKASAAKDFEAFWKSFESWLEKERPPVDTAIDQVNWFDKKNEKGQFYHWVFIRDRSSFLKLITDRLAELEVAEPKTLDAVKAKFDRFGYKESDWPTTTKPESEGDNELLRVEDMRKQLVDAFDKNDPGIVEAMQEMNISNIPADDQEMVELYRVYNGL